MREPERLDPQDCSRWNRGHRDSSPARLEGPPQ